MNTNTNKGGPMGQEIVQAGQQYSIADLSLMAKNVAESRLFAGAETEQAAFTLMLLCQAEGLHPIQAMRRYHIIKGRPSMRADAMQAEFQRNGGIIRWLQSDAEACSARFIHPTHAPEPGVTIGLTMKQANLYGLSKNELYAKYPDQMLRARVISQGVRMVLPGVVVGIYTPEEMDVIDVTPAKQAEIGEKARTGPRPMKELPDRRESIDEALKPKERAEKDPQARPANDKELCKLRNDRIGARGLDVRQWTKIVTDEVGEVNDEVNRYREQVGLNDLTTINCYSVERHMIRVMIEAGAKDPREPGPDGKLKKISAGKISAWLADHYTRSNWREWIRAGLAEYLAAKIQEGVAVADNEINGDVPPEPASPVEPAQANGQHTDAAGEPGWGENRQ